MVTCKIFCGETCGTSHQRMRLRNWEEAIRRVFLMLVPYVGLQKSLKGRISFPTKCIVDPFSCSTTALDKDLKRQRLG